MRYALCGALLALLSGVGIVGAQEPAPAPEGILTLATVSVTDVTLVQEGRSARISFTLENEVGTQPGVKYGVMLVEDGAQSGVPAHEFVFDEVITLLEDVPVKREVVYTAPQNLHGTFTVFLVSKNELGFPYGMVRAGSVTIEKVPTTLVVDKDACELAASSGDSKTPYEESNEIILKGGETLMSSCVIENTGTEPRTISPRYITHADSVFGKSVIVPGGSVEPVTVLPGEKKTVSFELPRATKAGSYVVTLYYDGEGNSSTYRYRVGESPRIDNIILSKPGYGVGDEAKIRLVMSTPNPGTYTLAVSLRQNDGLECGRIMTESVSLSGYTIRDIAIPISRICMNPLVEAVLTEGESTIVAQSIFDVTDTRDLTFTPTYVTGGETHMKFGASFFFSVIALAIGLGYLYYLLYKKISAPKAVIFMFVLSSALLFPSLSHAVTYLKEGCVVTADPDRGLYKTGDTMTVSGSVSGCSGTGVAVSLNSLSGPWSTIASNASGWYSGSFTVPSVSGALHTMYLDGDWIPSNVFNLGNPTLPSFPVVINMCPVTFNNYCELPPYESYFGEPVGWSGGACASGSTGNCNYTCQPDLSWRQNTNTCTVPPPPPPPTPGSAPEFTSTPTCQIQPNGSSCTGTVNVSVPGTYLFGADIKTCSGTLIQTVTPGNHTVSVNIPYSTACFNIHPWSMIPNAPTDTVNGGSSCVPGTTWNGSVCALSGVPGIPTNLVAFTWGNCGSKTIKLRWDAVANAQGYDVMRDGQLLGSVPLPYFDTVADGTTHTYRVRAWNASGPSAWSDPVQGTAPAACPGASHILDASGCQIPAGQSSCTSYVVWSTSNYTATNILQNGILLSSQSQGSMGRTTGFGTHTFTLRDGVTTLDSKSISVTCASGTWNGSICDDGGGGSNLPCPGTTRDPGCMLPPAAHGQTVNGTCNPATYTGTCSYTCTNGVWGAPFNNQCTTGSNPPIVVTGPPVLRASERIVKINTPVTIEWDTNNGNENSCSLTGGGLGSTHSPIPLNLTDPNGEEGSYTQTISGRTTFTLTCPSSGTASVTIEIIPDTDES